MDAIQVENGGNGLIVRVDGDFDAVLAKKACDVFSDVAMQAEGNVVVDLANSYFMDSSGIGALIFLHKRMRSAKLDVEVVNVPEQPHGLMNLLHIDKIMDVTSIN